MTDIRTLTRDELRQKIRRLGDDNQKLREENETLRAFANKAFVANDPHGAYADALVDALDLAQEGWAYASDYFREKWSFQERHDALRALVPTQRQSDPQEK